MEELGYKCGLAREAHIVVIATYYHQQQGISSLQNSDLTGKENWSVDFKLKPFPLDKLRMHL